MLPRDVRRARTVLFVYAASTGVVGLTTAIALPVDGAGSSLEHFWWIALGSVGTVGSLVALMSVGTATGAYAVLFWCFHFGLIAALGSGTVEPSEISRWDQSWVLGPFAADAALLALIGSLALASGASLVRALNYASPHHATASGGHEAAHPHGVAGSVLVFGAIGTWFGIVFLTGGIGGFFVPYVEYLRMTSDFADVVPFVWLALGCGIVMSITGRAGWLRTGAVAAVACQAFVALPLGLRGEILFPSVAAFVAWTRCGRGVSLRSVCLTGLALLVLIPLLREVRTTGVRDLSQVVLDIRPSDALAEMGASLHPVEKVVRWRAEGEPFEHGSSYWAPIERVFRRLLPGIENVSAEDDRRIMNVLVVQRVGAIGFSPVAEAYRNFGAFGVALVFAILGGVLAALDSIRDRRVAVLAMATVYVPLLINVRNSFVSVPAQCAAGILMVLGLGVIRHVVGSVMCKPYARAAYVRSPV